MIRVLIADDHAVVRHGLRQILDETPDMRVAGEAATPVELLEKVRAKVGDVLVLDLSMPGRSGLDMLKNVKRERPLLPVLVLSMHPEDQYAGRVLKAGAAGYLPKETAADCLVKAIRKVSGGGRYISAEQADKLVPWLDCAVDHPPHEQLSDREYEVLRAIASGKTVSEIARELHLSVKTVSTYRMRLLEKMRMQTNAELTHYAIKNALVD